MSVKNVSILFKRVHLITLNNLVNYCHTSQLTKNVDICKNPSQISQHIKKFQLLEKPINNQLIESEHDISKLIEQVRVPNPLDICNEDLSHVGPYSQPSYNCAKFANDSHTLQELIKLGVNLYKFDGSDIMNYIIGCDFEKDIQPYIQFYHDCGINADYLGKIISKNPYILKEDLDDLHTRIRYLRAHDFEIEMIKTILYKNAKWLMHNTKDIDSRLGYFQHHFKLKGCEIRNLVVKHPKLITYRMNHIKENTFSIREEMGFNEDETKSLLLTEPRVWTMSRRRIVDAFDYAHNIMMLPHETILQNAQILTCRKSRLESRYKFLVELGRIQFDPTKPLYVSPTNLIHGTDNEFCQNIAKTCIETYNKFLMTL